MALTRAGLAVNRSDPDSDRHGPWAEHGLEVGTGVVLGPIGRVDSLLHVAFRRLKSYFLSQAGDRDVASVLPPGRLVPARLLSMIGAYVERIILGKREILEAKPASSKAPLASRAG